MMRYQKVSPDCLPLNNGKKVTMKTCKEDGEATENGRVVPQNVYVNNGSSSSSSFETKSFRFRSPSRTQDNNNHNLSQYSSVSYSHQSDTNLHNHEPSNKQHQTQTQTQVQNQRPETSPSASSSPNRGGDMLLQWGHKKRSRVSRTEIRALTEEPLSSSAQVRQALKLKRRPVTCPNSDKLPTTSMPPPPPPLLALPSTAATSSSFSGRSRKVETSGFLPTRSLDDHCGGGAGNGSPSRISGGNNRVVCRSTAGKRSAHTEKSERKVLSSSGKSIKDEKPNGSSGQLGDHANQVDSRTNKTGATSEKVTDSNNNNNNTEVNEWPRIYIALSRKEKEDDFLAMKGTKLPQRPKKRAKNIDRTLQYCFPGMWLSDLTRSRYEVREKKCVKKQKWRGLKGMESLDSDSE